MPSPASCFPKGCNNRPKWRASAKASAIAGSQSPSRRWPDGSSRPNAEKPNGGKLSANASVAGRLFFPQSKALGIEPDDTVSPGVLQKMVYAGTNASSFKQASKDLKHEAELEISEQRIMRATKRIGHERVEEREAAVEAWESLSIPQQRQSPPKVAPPSVACVEMDGGRIQIRDRQSTAKETAEERRKGRFWRETKVGCLWSAASEVFPSDPSPLIPAIFVDSGKMREIVGEIKGFAGEADVTGTPQHTAREERKGRPQPLAREVVATRENVELFGKQLAAAAWALGFAAAPRKAFLGDGSETNWSVWRRHFSHFTPILDFVHALCYVYAAAMAGRSFAEAWPIYVQWAQWTWSGKVPLVLAALQERLAALGPPGENDAEDSLRRRVAESLRYLQNQQSRMRYDEYRRQGLPITSCHIESTIKQINRRVKGSEKFWSEGGAEALLQLAADYLSESDPLTPYWACRQAVARGQRHYQTAP
jgi:hypothetical protein